MKYHRKGCEVAMLEYRMLCAPEIDRALFRPFVRHQVVDQCLRWNGKTWVVRSDPFVDDWSEEDYQFLIACLQNTVTMGGVVYGAFQEDALKGFTSVEQGLFGGENRYLDLTSLHVSEDMRRSGIGRTLFQMAADWARTQGASKLYISSHSAIETQRFYRSLGCVDAAQPQQKHIESEPFDCQLEYKL